MADKKNQNKPKEEIKQDLFKEEAKAPAAEEKKETEKPVEKAEEKKAPKDKDEKITILMKRSVFTSMGVHASGKKVSVSKKLAEVYIKNGDAVSL